jgi:uncharacterized protein with LGFP repeats
VGSALAIDPKGYVLKPQTAADTVCGPAASCSAGYTVFCCTINHGANACPPGTFTAGWWKAADSSWCCGGYRYITDCNATCSKCTSGCSGDNICSSSCWNCGCKCGSTATCDQRRVCCNAFRYGQCNTHVRCSGGVACRVVSCVAPYKWDNCTTTSLSDNATAEHNAPCLQGCGPILTKYNAYGANGSPIGGSIGPERAVGDGRGRYVDYQRGAIYWSSSTDAHVVRGSAITLFRSLGGPRGVLKYPTTDLLTAADGAGWIQLFERGAITDSPASATHSVSLASYTRWVASGRETGELGYPLAERRMGPGLYWIQHFQKGAVADTPGSVTCMVSGWRYSQWMKHGGEQGELGYPTSDLMVSGTYWIQLFEHGALADTPNSVTTHVYGAGFDRWSALGRESGLLGYPVGDQRAGSDGGGQGQPFEHGELWWATGGTPYVVRGRVLTAWTADGGAGGRWGYPLQDTVTTPTGAQQQRFEGGTITA